MSFFVIASPDSADDQLDSPIIDLPNGGGEAAAIFLCEETARNEIREHGWQGEETIAELRPTEVLKWLSVLQDGGVERIGVGVSSEEPGFDTVLILNDPMTAFAELLRMHGEHS